jgi:hypothetical protein
LGISGSADDPANIKKAGNLVYTQFKTDTGMDYTFKGSDYADIHGTNTANMADFVKALNYALKNLDPDALVKYSKPEVPIAGHRKDLASALNLRNSGALIGSPFFADAGVFQTDIEDADMEGKVRLIQLLSIIADKSGAIRAVMLEMRGSKVNATDDFSIVMQNTMIPLIKAFIANGIVNV